MEVGVQVWVRCETESWRGATIIQKFDENDNCIIELSVDGTGEKRKLSVARSAADKELDSIKLQNEESAGNVNDLINLPFLHEPSILHCLQNRYVESTIYTFTGPILIAINPFKVVPLYTSQILESYYNAGLMKSQGIDGGSINKGLQLGPHVFSIADAAYREMMSRTASSADQTILISGESGAGKTETTKIVLRYLTTVGNSQGVMEVSSGSVMDKVLQSNPILEAFGNAKTLRNDNSSIFGKFIELHFSKRGHLIGGVIRTYLLEQVRLVKQQKGERAFHVFYQMLAGMGPEDKAARQLTEAKDFHFINQGATYTLKSFDDAHEYAALRKAWDILDFDATEQSALLDVMAGLLHLSEITFDAVLTGGTGSGDGSVVSAGEAVRKHLSVFSRLSGLPVDHVERALTVRTMSTRDETYEIRLTPAQAADARDAIAKSIYSKAFLYIVARVNESIRVNDESKIRSSINCLDIFGFECFQTNSFEQLCINYCNEQLQQQFNQFVFKLEQAEYEREKIEWSFIEFPDNQDCLDLIEHRQSGILAMLDDECKLPKASDEKFASRLYKSLESHGRFSANTTQKRDFLFCISHYAGPVVYLTTSFVEKNKDELPKEASTLLSSSSLPLLSKIYANVTAASDDAVAVATAKKGLQGAGAAKSSHAAHSVGAQFKDQLSLLMKSIYVTTPHYIRCLKPNDQNVPDKFDRMRTTEQLRYGGVLEAVRVARSGFPVRLSHSDFFARYRAVANPFCAVRVPLSLDTSAAGKVQDQCKLLLQAIVDPTMPNIVADGNGSHSKRAIVIATAWMGASIGTAAVTKESLQLGISKVFLRKIAHDVLEGRRTRRHMLAAVTIQGRFRSYRLRKRFIAILQSTRLIQKLVRGHIARRRVNEKRRFCAAVKLQGFWRRTCAQSQYSRYRRAVVTLQSCFRGNRGRRAAFALRRTRDAIRLQRIIRGALAIFRFKRVRKAIVVMQCCLRRRRARSVLKTLRLAAKDVGKLKTSNEALKKEIEELRHRAADETKRAQELARSEAEAKASLAATKMVARLREELEASKAALEAERVISKSLQVDLSVATAQVQKLKEEKIPLSEAAARCFDLEEEVQQLRQASSELSLQLTTARKEAEDAALTVLAATKNGDHVSEAPPPALPTTLDVNVQNLDSAAASVEPTPTTSPRSSANKTLTAQEAHLPPPPGSPKTALHSPKPAVNASSSSSPVGPAVIATFEKNLATLRAKLRIGIKAQLWEEGPNVRIQNFECIVQLDKSYEMLTFTSVAPRSTFTLFGTPPKVEVVPVKICNVVDCHPGAASIHEHFFTSMFGGSATAKNPASVDMMTLVVKIDAARLDKVNVQSKSLAAAAAFAMAELGGDVDLPPRVISLKLPQREDRNHLMTALRTMISDLHVNTPTMRSLVDGVKKGDPSGGGGHPDKKNRRASVNTVSSDGVTTSPRDLSSFETTTEVKQQLLLERKNYERLMLQLFALTNDLNEREETITVIKRRVSSLETTLAANEKMHEQDALIRLQLGKRLEQVLMDKEEALEELDLVQTKLESIRSAMALVDFSKAAALADSISSSKSPSRSTR